MQSSIRFPWEDDPTAESAIELTQIERISPHLLARSGTRPGCESLAFFDICRLKTCAIGCNLHPISNPSIPPNESQNQPIWQ